MFFEMKFTSTNNFINDYWNSYIFRYRKPKMWLILTFLAIATAFLSTNKRYRWIYIIMKTYKRDLRALVGFTKLKCFLWWWEWQQYTVTKLFADLVERHPNKIAIYFEDTSWTYKQVDEYSNRIANYFKKEGFEKGDCIALLLENRPEYPSIWLGLSKIGVVTALINTNLVNDPLLHSINVSKSQAIIFGSNHKEAIKTIVPKIDLKLYQLHETKSEDEVLSDFIDLTSCLNNISSKKAERIESTSRDSLIYIYTSGTTGLPKAAVISNLRFMFMSAAIAFLTRLKTSDIIYNPLPLYHTAGGLVGMGQMVIFGRAIAIRKKFSASNYWSDCEKYKCTVAQYVGEICRYVLAAPRKGALNHNVRAIFGNGLKVQIWEQYVETFGIKEVFEFYGATEGISNIVNLDNTPGCVGFVPRYAGFVYPMTLIKCNMTTGEPVHDEKGFCIKCGINEPGLVVAKINPKNSYQTFKGYSDKKSTDAKILQNVFEEGDRYFNSGDILEMDEFGSFYFKDRTGDTFRWKGENVSTCEVESIISTIVQLNDAVVYGVQIPKTEGRAGMAAIVDTNGTLNLDTLCNGLRENLPSYAIPIFIRVMKSVPLTGTYKLKKVELQNEAYDMDKIEDQIYFYDGKLKTYVELTRELYSKIVSGQISL